MFYNLKQKILKNKYGKFKIPIKNNNNWYYIDHDLDNVFVSDGTQYLQFEQYANVGFYFHYEYGTYKDTKKDKIKEFKDMIHSHDFEYVLDDLYDFPKTFNIPKIDEYLYSKQELDYINKLQKKLLEDGLDDIGYLTDLEYEHEMLTLVYSIGELKKRNINKLHGISIKKYLKRLDDKNYIYVDDEWKINVV